MSGTEDPLFAVIDSIHVYRDSDFSLPKQEKECEIRRRVVEVLQQLPPSTDGLSSKEKAMIHFLRGKALEGSMMFCPDAHSELSRAVKLDPSLYAAWNYLGHSFLKKNDLEAAADCFKRALTLQNNKVSLRELSRIERLTSKTTSGAHKALSLAKDAVKMDISDGNSWLALGNVYLNMYFSASHNRKELQSALTAFSQALKDPLSAKNPDLYYNRGAVLLFLQEYSEAYSAFQKAAAMDPSMEEAQQSIRQLEERVLGLNSRIKSKCGMKKRELERIVHTIPKDVNSNVMLLSDKDDENSEFHCRVVATATDSNTSPLIFVAMDRESNFFAFSAYNVTSEAFPSLSTLKIRRSVRRTVKALGVEFEQVEVSNPDDIRVNGKPIAEQYMSSASIEKLSCTSSTSSFSRSLNFSSRNVINFRHVQLNKNLWMELDDALAQLRDGVSNVETSDILRACHVIKQSVIRYPSGEENDLREKMDNIISSLLGLCGHSASDIRVAAEDSIAAVVKRLSRAHHEQLISVLFRSMKSTKGLSQRAAMRQFSSVCKFIKPKKSGKFTTFLLPQIMLIINEGADEILESMGESVSEILKFLGFYFSLDNFNELVDGLIRILSQKDDAIQRSAATAIGSACLYVPVCPWPSVAEKIKYKAVEGGDVDLTRLRGSLVCLFHVSTALDKLYDIRPRSKVEFAARSLALPICETVEIAFNQNSLPPKLLSLELLAKLQGNLFPYFSSLSVWKSVVGLTFSDNVNPSLAIHGLEVLTYLFDKHVEELLNLLEGKQLRLLRDFLEHVDFNIRGKAVICICRLLRGCMVHGNLSEFLDRLYSDWEFCGSQNPLIFVGKLVSRGLSDTNSLARKAACKAFSVFLNVCLSDIFQWISISTLPSEVTKELQNDALEMLCSLCATEDTYWSTQEEVLSLLRCVDWTILWQWEQQWHSDRNLKLTYPLWRRAFAVCVKCLRVPEERIRMGAAASLYTLIMSHRILPQEIFPGILVSPPEEHEERTSVLMWLQRRAHPLHVSTDEAKFQLSRNHIDQILYQIMVETHPYSFDGYFELLFLLVPHMTAESLVCTLKAMSMLVGDPSLLSNIWLLPRLWKLLCSCMKELGRRKFEPSENDRRMCDKLLRITLVLLRLLLDDSVEENVDLTLFAFSGGEWKEFVRMIQRNVSSPTDKTADTLGTELCYMIASSLQHCTLSERLSFAKESLGLLDKMISRNMKVGVTTTRLMFDLLFGHYKKEKRVDEQRQGTSENGDRREEVKFSTPKTTHDSRVDRDRKKSSYATFLKSPYKHKDSPGYIASSRTYRVDEVINRSASSEDLHVSENVLRGMISYFEPIVRKAMKAYGDSHIGDAHGEILSLVCSLLECSVEYSGLDKDEQFLLSTVQACTEVDKHIPKPNIVLKEIMRFIAILFFQRKYESELIEFETAVDVLCSALSSSMFAPSLFIPALHHFVVSLFGVVPSSDCSDDMKRKIMGLALSHVPLPDVSEIVFDALSSKLSDEMREEFSLKIVHRVLRAVEVSSESLSDISSHGIVSLFRVLSIIRVDDNDLLQRLVTAVCSPFPEKTSWEYVVKRALIVMLLSRGDSISLYDIESGMEEYCNGLLSFLKYIIRFLDSFDAKDSTLISVMFVCLRRIIFSEFRPISETLIDSLCKNGIFECLELALARPHSIAIFESAVIFCQDIFSALGSSSSLSLEIATFLGIRIDSLLNGCVASKAGAMLLASAVNECFDRVHDRFIPTEPPVILRLLDHAYDQSIDALLQKMAEDETFSHAVVSLTRYVFSNEDLLMNCSIQHFVRILEFIPNCNLKDEHATEIYTLVANCHSFSCLRESMLQQLLLKLERKWNSVKYLSQNKETKSEGHDMRTFLVKEAEQQSLSSMECCVMLPDTVQNLFFNRFTSRLVWNSLLRHCDHNSKLLHSLPLVIRSMSARERLWMVSEWVKVGNYSEIESDVFLQAISDGITVLKTEFCDTTLALLSSLFCNLLKKMDMNDTDRKMVLTKAVEYHKLVFMMENVPRSPLNLSDIEQDRLVSIVCFLMDNQADIALLIRHGYSIPWEVLHDLQYVTASIIMAAEDTSELEEALLDKNWLEDVELSGRLLLTLYSPHSLQNFMRHRTLAHVREEGTVDSHDSRILSLVCNAVSHSRIRLPRMSSDVFSILPPSTVFGLCISSKSIRLMTETEEIVDFDELQSFFDDNAACFIPLFVSDDKAYMEKGRSVTSIEVSENVHLARLLLSHNITFTSNESFVTEACTKWFSSYVNNHEFDDPMRACVILEILSKRLPHITDKTPAMESIRTMYSSTLMAVLNTPLNEVIGYVDYVAWECVRCLAEEKGAQILTPLLSDIVHAFSARMNVFDTFVEWDGSRQLPDLEAVKHSFILPQVCRAILTVFEFLPHTMKDNSLDEEMFTSLFMRGLWERAPLEVLRSISNAFVHILTRGNVLAKQYDRIAGLSFSLLCSLEDSRVAKEGRVSQEEPFGLAMHSIQNSSDTPGNGRFLFVDPLFSLSNVMPPMESASREPRSVFLLAIFAVAVHSRKKASESSDLRGTKLVPLMNSFSSYLSAKDEMMLRLIVFVTLRCVDPAESLPLALSSISDGRNLQFLHSFLYSYLEGSFEREGVRDMWSIVRYALHTSVLRLPTSLSARLVTTLLLYLYLAELPDEVSAALFVRMAEGHQSDSRDYFPILEFVCKKLREALEQKNLKRELTLVDRVEHAFGMS